ncbi:TetR/AcrR family transcriptional regulator [Nocardia spumae]|uniref:TetR/AcrR family transcriptional regulator n=1 Tax=Nocardia spumae TaxID=2887190 RepID=UPI001D14F745|nr:TetR-like C-terminal domain-containing protein [Nocardia spumae]
MTIPVTLRDRLIQATIHLLSTEGLGSLTVRRVSQICDVSTMAIYSNFTGMPGLLRAVGSAGFAQLSARLAGCGRSDDPLTDILVLGFAFHDEALRKPELFRVMFATEPPKVEVELHRGNILSGTGDCDFDNFAESFDHMVCATQRAVDAGLVRTGNARAAAAQFWTGLYGFAQLDLAGLYGDRGVGEVLLPSMVNIMIGMGADPDRMRQSASRAVERGLSPAA